MLNQKYLSSYTKSDIDVIKAYVHKKTVEKLNRSYFNDYMRDVLIRKVKAVIEKIITIRIFEIKNLAEKLSIPRNNFSIIIFEKLSRKLGSFFIGVKKSNV
jgi:CTP:phosphocholine cytidylyltransferase-like protein